MEAVNQSNDFFSVQSTYAIAIVLPLLDAIAVGLRFYTRRRQNLPLQSDDWFILASLVLVIGLGVDLIIGVALHGLAYPVPIESEDATTRAIAISSQTEWAASMNRTLALGCVKLSVLCFYWRIFCTGTTNLYKIVIFLMMGIVAAWTISFFFGFLFACKGNFSAWWGSFENLVAQCVQTYNMELGLAVSDVITDGIIILLPIPMVWNLQLSLAKKIAVSLIFLIGAMAVAGSATRLVFVLRSTGNVTLANEDLFITRLFWWGMFESGLGIIAACLPTLRFLLRDFSLKAIIRSVRSVFSLASWGSHLRLRDSQDKAFARTSTTSHTQALAAYKNDHSDVDSYEMELLQYNMPVQRNTESANAQPGRIIIENSFKLQHEPV